MSRCLLFFFFFCRLGNRRDVLVVSILVYSWLIFPLPRRKQWHREDIQKLWKAPLILWRMVLVTYRYRRIGQPLRMLFKLEITGIIRKEGAWIMYLAGIYEAVEDLTSWKVEDNQTIRLVTESFLFYSLCHDSFMP